MNLHNEAYFVSYGGFTLLTSKAIAGAPEDSRESDVNIRVGIYARSKAPTKYTDSRA